MPSRDEHSFDSRRQQIIDGALQVFASKGFEKATNKDIAIASGIGSPGLIYHYFQDKSDLFQQVVEQRVPLLRLLTESEEALMDKPIEEVLLIFARSFLRVIDNPTSVALMKLIAGEIARQPSVAAMLNQIAPDRSIGFLTRYLEKQIAAGVLKPVDSRAAARCFMGSLIAYLGTREIFRQTDALELPSNTMVRTAVEIFLRGTQASASANEG